MAVVDPRLNMARAIAASKASPSNRVVTSAQAMQGIRGGVVPGLSKQAQQGSESDLVALARRMFTDAQRERSAVDIAQGGHGDVGGWRGLVGDAFGNPISRTILKPLEILDVPRRAVISSIDEATDALTGREASWDQWKQNVKDPTYGFGRITGDATGNKWINRVIGFTGDVALDPLTYASFGAGEAAGQSGRIATAQKALEIGLGEEKALAIAKLGRAAMTADDIDRLGLRRSGLYFFGKRLPAVRVPGSEALGQMAESSLAKIRLAGSETALGKFAQKVFTPNVNREARLMLARGEAPVGKGAQLIGIVTSRDVQRTAINQSLQMAQHDLEGLVNTTIDKGSRSTVHEVLEGARAPMNEAEAATASAAEFHLKKQWELAQVAMHEADPSANLGKVDNYFPHMPSQDARKYMANPAKPYAPELLKGFDDGDPVSIFKHRKLKAGESFFGQKLAPEDINVRRLNEIARAGGFNGEFFETDIVKVLDQYNRQFAQQMGLAARIKDLREKGVYQIYDREIGNEAVVMDQAIKDQKAVVQRFNTELKDARDAAVGVSRSSIDSLKQMRDVISGRLDRTRGLTSTLLERHEEAQQLVVKTERDLKYANEYLQRQTDVLNQLFQGEVPEVAQTMVGELYWVQRQMADYAEQWRQVANGSFEIRQDLVQGEKALSDLEAKSEALQQRIAQLQDGHATAMEFNDQLAVNYDRIVSGKLGDAEINPIGRAMGVLPNSQATERAKLAKFRGSQQEFVNEVWDDLADKNSGHWLADVNRETPLKAAAVKTQTDDSVNEIMRGATAGSASLGDARAAGMWLLLRDEKFYAGQLPEALTPLRDDLVSALKDADASDNYARRLAADTRSQRSTTRLVASKGVVQQVAGDMENDLETLNRLHDLLDVRGVQLGDEFYELDDVAEEGVIKQIDELKAKTYSLGQGATKREYNLTQEDVLKVRQLAKGVQTDVGKAEGLRRATVAEAAANISEKMSAYMVASEVFARHAAVSEQFAVHWMIPGEQVTRDIINKAAQEQGMLWDGRLRDVLTAQQKLIEMKDALFSRLDSSYGGHTTELGTAATEQVRAGQLLKEMLDEAYQSEDGAALLRVIGPAVAASEDPKEMLRRLGVGKLSLKGEARKAYIQDVVKPWFEATGGGKFTQEAAKARMNSAASLGVSPMATNITPARSRRAVEEWFTTLLGGEQKMASAPTGERWTRTLPGSLHDEAKRAKRMAETLAAASDENVDIEKFLAFPGVKQRVPSMQAALLRSSADRLERKMGGRALAAEAVDVTSAESAAADAAMEKAILDAAAVGRTTSKLPGRPVEQVDDLYGSEVEAARKVQRQVARIKLTPEYTHALADQDLHEMLVALAPYDLSKMHNPITGEAGFFTELGGGKQRLRSEVRLAADRDPAMAKRLAELLDSEEYKSGKFSIAMTRPSETDAAEMILEPKPFGQNPNAIPVAAKMPDGSNVIFSKSEANSLFTLPMNNSEKGAALSRMKVLAKAREDLQHEMDYLTSVYAKGKHLMTPDLVRSSQQRFKDIQADIARLDLEGRNISARLSGANEGTRAAALEKARILVQGADGSEPWYNPGRLDLLPAKAKLGNTDDVIERVANQKAMHATSPSRKLLDKLDELAQSEEALLAKRWMKKADAAKLHAARMEGAAKEAEQRLFQAHMDIEQEANLGAHLSENAMQMRDGGKAVMGGDVNPEQLRGLAGEMDAIHPTDRNLSVPTTEASYAPETIGKGQEALTYQEGLQRALGDRQEANAARLARSADEQTAIVEKINTLSDRQAEILEQIDTERDKAIFGYDEKVGRKKVVHVKGQKEIQGEARFAIYGKEAAVAEARSAFDSAEAVRGVPEFHQKFTIPRLEQRLEVVEKALQGAPEAVKKVDGVSRWELSDWAQRSKRAIEDFNLNPDDPVARVVLDAAASEGKLMGAMGKKELADDMLKMLQEKKSLMPVPEQLKKGWSALDSMNTPGLKAQTEIRDMMTRMQQIEQPAFARELNRFMGGYTQFFKSYATLSPGFHVRNALSNTFMLVASGARPKNLAEGFTLWRDLQRSVESGATFEQWIAKLPAEQQKAARIAVDASYAVGGGRTSEMVGQLTRDSSRILDNKALRASRRVGGAVEGSAHFMLAYDSAVKGLDRHMATARVKRFLFDYTDLSTADQAMRSIVPFWIWMSHNLPLQIANQWANPKAYAIYNSFVRNVREDDGDSIVPSWLTEQGGFSVGGDNYLAPDLGFTRVQEQLQEFGDPARLASYVNPGIRVPFEVLGGRQLYNNVPFSDTPQPVQASFLSGPVGHLLEALGQAHRNSDGELVTSSKWNYALKNTLPPLAQSERLLPSTERGKDSQLSAWANYLGIPIRQVTPSMRESEKRRRELELKDLATKARQLGFQP